MLRNILTRIGVRTIVVKMNNPTKTFLFLSVFSTLTLFIGYMIYGRQGLLTGFALAISLNFFIYFYSEHRLREIFKGKEIEGADPWDILKIVKELAYKMKIPPPQIIMIPLMTPTAFSVGRNWDSAQIIVSKGLVESMTKKEVVSVLAHEMAHIRKLDTLSFGVGSALAGACMSWAHGMDRTYQWIARVKNPGPGLFTSIVAPLAALLVKLTVNPNSEYEADKFAADAVGDPEIFAESLWKLQSYAATRPIRIPLSTAHLFVVNPLTTRGTNRYFHTQPSVESRIEKLIGRYPL